MIRPLLKIWPAVLILVSASISTKADTIFLKSGEKLDGKILSETATQYTLEYHVSASITDTRTVQKTDVEKIDKEMPDEQPYQAIKGLKLGPNSLPAASYEAAVNRLQGFVNQFAQSSHAKEIQQNLQAFQEEKKRVDGGDIKLNDRWFNKEEAQKERVQLTGQSLYNYMQDQGRRGDLVGAMNTFDQIEKTAAGARAYPEAVDLAKKYAVSLKSAADQAKANWKVQKAERDKGIQIAAPAEKAEITAANDRRQKQEDAEIAAATRAGLSWPPFLPDNEKVLDGIGNKAVEAQKKLVNVPVQKMRQSLALTDKARDQVGQKDFVAADASLKQARELWSANELASRMAPDIAAAKVKAEAETKAAASVAAAATPTPNTSHASSGAPSSGGEEKPIFFFTPVGIVVSIVGIIFVLAALAAYRKVARRANEILE
jgi:hypothetical protein